MDKHKLIILGLGFGIILFFFGIGIYYLLIPIYIFNRIPQQISSIFKLSGMGQIVISMIVGGFFNEKLDKESKSLLILFGVILFVMNIIIASYTSYY